MRAVGCLAALCLAAGCGISETELQARVADLEKCQSDLSRSRNERTTREAEIEGRAKKLEDRVRELQQRQEVFTRQFKGDEKLLDQVLARLQASARRGEELKLLSERLAELVKGGRVRVLVERSMIVVRVAGDQLFSGEAVSTAGGQVLTAVAAALRELPNRDFLVAVHPDLKVEPAAGKGKAAHRPSSFERATVRAASAAAVLRGQGMPPDRLAIAGHSEFGALLGQGHGDRLDVWLLPNPGEIAPIQ